MRGREDLLGAMALRPLLRYLNIVLEESLMKVNGYFATCSGGCIAVLLMSPTLLSKRGISSSWSMLRRNWKVASEYKVLAER